MKKIFIALLVYLLSACQQVQSPRYAPSASLPPYQFAKFADYRQATADWLQQHRLPVTRNADWEVTLNTPFSCGEQFNKGVMLVHGLGDSPYFFHDVARDLCQAGYQVRTILLPGHGSKPGDMLQADYATWQEVTNYQVAQFARDVDTLVLGGFSTGANLVTLTAANRDDIAGLVLFSPAFQPDFFVTRLAPYATALYPWPNLEDEDNPTRYNSIAMQGFSAYQQSVTALSDTLEARRLSVPVFMVVAEKDSVVNVDKVADAFHSRFTGKPKTMMWLGEQPPSYPGVTGYTMQLPQQRIGAASHMAVLFDPGNVLYGTKGSLRICDNGQSDSKTEACKRGEVVWYGPWGYTEEDKVFARLTYNPYYPTMLSQIQGFLKQVVAQHTDQ
ncbi:lysophospholipase [Alteromonas sp. ASW11-19]|uniref:Lysophospholipase n=1 Tax=Alteromonas salexigens TaxID=2982530 RepID=A0ABT2VQM9_9ALTE|nr:lysophospholipase [Alteromonas salexigens]MCU7555188.1 lysophospholipase [Alteromonas salexigens]